MTKLLPFLMLAILAAAVLARHVSKTRFLTLPVVLVALGFVSSELWVLLGKDTGLRWEMLRDLVFHLLLPILIFEAAINMRLRALRRDGLLIAALSVPLLLIAAMLAGGIVFYAVGARLSHLFPLALLIGVMISATDPTSIPGLTGGSPPGGRLTRLLGGESLINDATAITLFVLLSAMLVQPEINVRAGAVATQFVLVALGGVLTGVALGWLFDRIIRPLDDIVMTTASTLVLAFVSFWLNEHVLGGSGVVATLAAGLTFAMCQNSHRSEEDVAFALTTWRVFGFCADAMLFFLVGMSITVTMFQENWLPMLAGILAALVSRAVIVYLGLGPLARIPGQQPLGFRDLNVTFWGGTRGAIAMALALSLSMEIPHWYTIQSTVYGVALFGLFVQTPLVDRLLRRQGTEADTRSSRGDKTAQTFSSNRG